MPFAKTISRDNTGLPDYVDFNRLRAEGLRHLGKLSGMVWTDHNTHDPGVTILEALIFALIDLGYRINTDNKDLFAHDPMQAEDRRFFTAKEILSCNPLTINDYRKLLIDIPGVRNAWLEPSTLTDPPLYLQCDEAQNASLSLQGKPGATATNDPGRIHLNGIYKVWIQPDPIRPGDGSNSNCQGDSGIDQIIKEATARLQAHRNLCEDFEGVYLLQEEQIGLCTAIEIDPASDTNSVLADMFLRLEKFISPVLPFYTLEALLAKQQSIEAIFEGRPLLQESHGFIDNEELQRHELRTELRTTDLYKVMLDTPGVVAIRNLSLFNYLDGVPQTEGALWSLCLTKGHFPVLVPELCQINILKNGVPTGADFQSVAARFRKRLTAAEKSLRKPYDLDQAPPAGDYNPARSTYYSIQNDFPRIYAVGEGGLPQDAPASRKAQALQLKAYLLFFDQLMAGWLDQMQRAGALFSVKSRIPSKLPPLHHGLDTVPHLSDLIRGGDVQFEGDDITGTGKRYHRGDAILYPSMGFIGNHTSCFDAHFFSTTPDERDHLVQLVMSTLENANYETLSLPERDEDLKEDSGYQFGIRFPFNFPGRLDPFLLQSFTEFETREQAIREAESLIFLGLQTENFKIINRAEQQQYTFEIVYEPRRYEKHLEKLDTTGISTAEQRAALLNHLLARFGEDFSEYALLSFAKRNNEYDSTEELLDDQEKFLSGYDNISRNRGKGFDYSLRTAVWDTENTSGLERRVAGLMGINDWKRHTLSPFTVEPRIKPSVYEVKDYCGQTAWRWTVYAPHNTSFESYWTKVIKAAAGNAERYHRIDCESQCMYGFELRDENNCLLAVHPETYADAQKRDEKIKHYLGLYGSAYSDGCWHVTFPMTPGGSYFYLFDKNGTKLLQSARPLGTEAEARVLWLQTRNRAYDRAHYEITEDAYHRYRFIIKAADGSPLAVQSVFSTSRSDAEKAAAVVWSMFDKARLDVALTQSAGIWNWQWQEGSGALLLESIYSFETEEQASLACYDALKDASDPGQYEKTFDPAGNSYGFFLTRTFPATQHEPAYQIRIGTHPKVYTNSGDPAAAAAERDAAIDRCVQLAEETIHFTGKLTPKANAVRMQWSDEKGNVLLDGTLIFPDAQAAVAAWSNMLVVASEIQHYRITAENNGYAVHLYDRNTLIAGAHSDFACEAYAQVFVEKLATDAFKKNIFFKIIPVEKAFGFKLTDAAGKYVLTSIAWYETRREAAAAYLSALRQANIPAHWQIIGNSIALVDDKGLIIAKGEPSSNPKQLGDILSAITLYFSGNVALKIREIPGAWHFTIAKDQQVVLESPIDYLTREDAALAAEKAVDVAACVTDGYHFRQAEDGCNFSFEIVDQTGIVAVHPNWYPPEKWDKRQEMIDMLAQWLCRFKMTVAFEDEPERFHWELIWDKCCSGTLSPVLVSPLETDKTQAEADFLQQIKNAGNHLIATTAHGIYTFHLASATHPDQVAAYHPQRYNTEAAQTAAIEKLKKYLSADWCKATGQWNIPQTGWIYRLDKPEAVAYFCPQFPSRLQRNDCLRALAYGADCWQSSWQPLDTENNIIEENGMFRFLVKTGDKIWWQSPKDTAYSTRDAAYSGFLNELPGILQAARNPLAYLQKDVSIELRKDFMSNNPVKIAEIDLKDITLYEADKNERISAALGFGLHLQGQDYQFALLYGFDELITLSGFSTLEAAQNAYFALTETLCFQQLRDAFTCRKAVFSEIDTCARSIVRTGSQYSYQLLTRGELLWQNAKWYESETAAAQAFDDTHVHLLEFARDEKLYELIDTADGGFYYSLRNYEGNIVAYSNPYDATNTPETVFNNLRQHALRYPIFTEAEQFGFQLYDSPTHQVLFVSAKRYQSPAAAWSAFHHFLALLQQPENLRPQDNELNCQFSMVVMEAGLESTELFKDRSVDNIFQSGAELAWEALDEMLVGFGENTNIRHQIDMPSCCGFSNFIADQSYQVAKSWNTWHTAGDRARARDQLFTALCCPDKPPKAPVICNGYYNMLQNPGANYVTPLWQTGFGLLHSDAADSPCRDQLLQTCAGNVEATLDVLLAAPALVDFIVLARSTDCYIQVAEPGSCGPADKPGFRLGLLDAQNRLVALGNTVFTEIKDWEDARRQALERAWKFPIVRKGAGYGFQLNGPLACTACNEQGQCVQWEAAELFESVQVFGSPGEAAAAYDHFIDLLCVKSNWIPGEQSDTGAFNLVIADPAQVMARQPVCFSFRNECLTAATYLHECLESEGFHIVEHILLRPRTATDALFEICPPAGACQYDFSDPDFYLPGVDPYSFVATVLIPYWSPRFRDIGLRQFFEKTLRSEAPAHVWLKIAWIDARTMHTFETVYRRWLENQFIDDTSCERQHTLETMLTTLQALRNRYPANSRLYCETCNSNTADSGLAILNQSTI